MHQIDESYRYPHITVVQWCFAEWIYLRLLASLSTAAPGSTAWASNSCTSSSRDFFTVRRVLRSKTPARQTDEGTFLSVSTRWQVIHKRKSVWVLTRAQSGLCKRVPGLYGSPPPLYLYECAPLTQTKWSLWVNTWWVRGPGPARSASTASPCQPAMTAHKLHLLRFSADSFLPGDEFR